MKSKISYSVQSGAGSVEDSENVSNFVIKSIGAALCGAAIPAVVFYFLF